MPARPLVSVIIPNYNHARFLPNRLKSVLAQTFTDFEVILLDDCSADGSQSILTDFATSPRVSRLVLNTENSGSTFKQWAKGLQYAKGDYIWFAESDDCCEPQLLEELIAPLENNANIVLSYCQSTKIDADGCCIGLDTWANELEPNRWRSNFTNHGQDEISKYLRFRNTIVNASAVCVRAKTLEQIILPENMRFCGDWVTWLRSLRIGDIAYNSQPLNQFRQHDSTTRAVTDLTKLKATLSEFLVACEEGAKGHWIQFESLKHYDWILDAIIRGEKDGVELSHLPTVIKFAKTRRSIQNQLYRASRLFSSLLSKT